MRWERVCGAVRRIPWMVVSVGWVAGLGLLAYCLSDRADVLAGLAITPVVACAAGARRRWVLASGLLALGVLCGDLFGDAAVGAGPVIGAAVALLAVQGAVLCGAARRNRLAGELDRTREIALAAQQVLLRRLPARVGGWTVAGEYVSASRGAHIGGDFYEVLATPFGLRALIGDARGHGLPAIGVVAALLGCFREAAHQESELTGVVDRLDGALHRHLRDRGDDASAGDPVAEEFATVQLLQLADDGAYQALNCGHPEPYLLGPGTRPLPLGDPLPPLGLLAPGGCATPPAAGRIAAGEGLLLYTDGLQDARDRAGRFFPLEDTLTGTGVPEALSPGPVVAARLRTAVQRHTADRLADDMAVLVLIRDAARTPDVDAVRTTLPPPAAPRRSPSASLLRP